MARSLILLLIAAASFALGYFLNFQNGANLPIDPLRPVESTVSVRVETDVIEGLESPHLSNLVEFYQTKLPDATGARYELLRGYAGFGQQGPRERSEFNELIRLLAEHDAYALYAWSQDNPNLQPKRREMILLGALKQLAVTDTTFAMAAAAKIKDYWARSEALTMVLEQVSAIDSERALGYALDADLSLVNANLLYNVLRDLTFADPQNALDLAQNRLPEKFRVEGFACVIKAHAQVDFDAAVKIVSELENAQVKDMAMTALYGEALNLDIAKADEFFASTGVSPMKDNVLRMLVYERPSEMPVDRAIELIETYGTPNNRNNMLQSLYSQLAIEEPSRIEGILAEKIGSGDMDSFFHELGWQSRDADAFDEVYASIPEGDLRSDYLGQYLRSLGYSRSQEASELFLKMQDEVNSTETAGAIARNMAEYDVHASLQFAAQITDSNHQAKALEKITDQWFNVDAESAWEWLIEQQSANPDDAKLNDALQYRAIVGISESQPAQALKFALDISVGNASRQRAVDVVLPKLFVQDAQAVDDYLDTISDSAVKDKAYQEIAQSSYYPDTALALSAGLKISDPENRRKEISRLLKYWAKNKSQQHILESIETLNLSPEDAKLVDGMME
jgi:hypothetical protein